LELEFEELFELQLEDELELEFEELLDELFEDELEDEFELELPATRVRVVSSAAAAFAPSVSASSGGVPACAAPTASAAVAMPASVVILTVLFIWTFSFAYAGCAVMTTAAGETPDLSTYSMGLAECENQTSLSAIQASTAISLARQPRRSGGFWLGLPQVRAAANDC